MKVASFWFAIVVVLAGCLSSPSPDDALQPKDGPLQGSIRAEIGVEAAGPVVDVGETLVFSIDADDAVWRFSDGEVARGLTVEHTFVDVGIHRVSVTWTRDGEPGVHHRLIGVGQAGAPIEIHANNTPTGATLTADAEGDVVWDVGGQILLGTEVHVAFNQSGEHGARAYLADGTVIRFAETTIADPPVTRFIISSAGDRGPEPTTGRTSSGCLFLTMRGQVAVSCDAGANWSLVDSLLDAPPRLITADPHIWVDPVTDRVFHTIMNGGGPVCFWVAWSDDDGATWTANPFDCQTPVVDHQKLTTGPWTGPGLSLNPMYPQAVYLCYNKSGAGAWCQVSLDGGATFPISNFVAMGDNLNQVIDPGVPIGGLHGQVRTGPDGSVYLPIRNSSPLLGISRDNGLTWKTVEWQSDAGTPPNFKDPAVAIDGDNNVYYAHIGEDNKVHAFRSLDAGETWSERSWTVSGPALSTVFPEAIAGAPGRVAFAFLGTEDAARPTDDVPDDAHWYPYVTYSLDADASNPTWTTVRVDDDPLQRGSICLGTCVHDPEQPSSQLDPDAEPTYAHNGNLLDFIGMSLDPDGRILFAYADGCTEGCSDDLAAPPSSSRDNRATLAIMDAGPSFSEAVWLDSSQT